METRTASICILLASMMAGSYACVGDDPTTNDSPNSNADGGGSDAASSDASTSDATSDSSTTTTTDAASDTDSGIDAGPPPVTRAFVSSMHYFGGSIGGLDGADTACQALATAAGQGKGWKAWLSTSTTNAKDHIVLGSGKIVLVDGATTIVEHGTDLIGDGGLEHAINQDETKSAVAPAIVWSGTTEHGVIYTGNINNTCHDWAVEDGGASAGETNQTSNEWTNAAIEPCSNSYSIFCFGP